MELFGTEQCLPVAIICWIIKHTNYSTVTHTNIHTHAFRECQDLMFYSVQPTIYNEHTVQCTYTYWNFRILILGTDHCLPETIICWIIWGPKETCFIVYTGVYVHICMYANIYIGMAHFTEILSNSESKYTKAKKYQPIHVQIFSTHQQHYKMFCVH